MNTNQTIQVPRTFEVTKSKSKEDTYLDRDWNNKKKLFNIDKYRYEFGSPESKAAWKARIAKTRSF
jgi:hypothetical protein